MTWTNRSKGLSLEMLAKWLGEVGWVHPSPTQRTATIAVKVIGVNQAWGRWLFRVQPLAGTGSWQVDVDSVEFEREGEL
jgi:hypothetical protein